MRRTALVTLFLFLFSTLAFAGTFGETDLSDAGDPDGWSGISYLSGYGSIPAGEQVTSWEFYADADRADGVHNAQPVVIRDDGTELSIFDAGPVSSPTAEGIVTNAWGSAAIPGDGASYYAGAWQWNTGVNNEAGGLIPFAGAGGLGMAQIDLDGTTFVPAAGEVLPAAGHASAADGRAYQFAFTTAVPEPSGLGLGLAAALGAIAFIRRRR